MCTGAQRADRISNRFIQGEWSNCSNEMNNIDSIRFNNRTGLSMLNYFAATPSLTLTATSSAMWGENLPRRQLPLAKRTWTLLFRLTIRTPKNILEVLTATSTLTLIGLSSGGCHIMSELVSKTSKNLSCTESLKCASILSARTITSALNWKFPWNTISFLVIMDDGILSK